MISDDELSAGLQKQILQSDNWGGGNLAEMRTKALQYYYGSQRGDEQPGCSAVISTDVADMLESVIAGVMPAFSTQRVIEFESLSEDDDEQARKESDAVNYVIMNENAGEVMLESAFRDALLLRNGFTKVWLKESRKSETSRYSHIQPEQLMYLQDAQKEGWTRIPQKIIENDDGTVDVTFKDTFVEKKLCVHSIDPVRMFLTANWDEFDLQTIPFCAELIYYSRSDLVDMGYPQRIIDELPVAAFQSGTAEAQRNTAGQVPEYFQPAQQLIECYECFWLVDCDGDGIAERRHFLLAGQKVLMNIEADFVIYATGTPILQPHRITGLGLYDKLSMVQDVKTATLRQYLDCFQNGNLGRIGYVKGMVNTDHLLNPRPSGAVEMLSPDALLPIPNLDIGASAQALLGYMDTVRNARGGASLDLQTAGAQIAGETAHGIERQYGARELMAAMFARTLTNTLVADTYKNMHRALRLWKGGDLSYKTQDGHQTTNTNEWPERVKVIVRAGLSPGERAQKTGALQGVMAQQQQMMQAGLNGVTTTLDGVYDAVIDWCRASGLDDPEQYFLDPESDQSKQMQQQSAQIAQQQAAQAQQLQMAMLQIESQKNQIAKQKNDIELLKNQQENRFKYVQLQSEEEQTEAKIVGAHASAVQTEVVRKELNADRYRPGD